MVAVSTAEMNALEGLSEDELYARLAIADAGTSDLVASGLEKLELVASVASAADKDSVWIKLIELGRKIFDEYWPKAKKYVCDNWKSEDSPIKDWIEKIGDTLADLLGLPAKIVVIILTIAAKAGFDRLCEVNA